MTDSELRQAFSKGFANPQHLHDLLSRTDLPSTRQIDVRHHLSQAYLSRQISDDALQRFVSQLNKAKNLDQFDQVLAILSNSTASFNNFEIASSLISSNFLNIL